LRLRFFYQFWIWGAVAFLTVLLYRNDSKYQYWMIGCVVKHKI